jgi:rhodanese-related sulfurtransferase
MEATQKVATNRVTLDQVKERLDRGDPTVLIDARNSVGWNSSATKIPGAFRIEPDNIDQGIDLLPKDQLIIVYCNGQQEAYSLEVSEALKKRGFKDVYVLEGGFYSWLGAGYPLEAK